MKENELFDVTIIGGGPAGLYSAFYSGLREMKTKIIEFQPELGGKIQVYPEKTIWDVGGLAPISGAKLMEQLIQQGLTFDPEVCLNEKVVSLSRNDEGIFVMTTASGRVHYSKTVIVAVGSGILKPQKLSIEGAEKFEVSNLHYTVKSLKQFKDKTVVISGGGNAAMDWANALEPVAKRICLVYRKEAMTGHEAQASAILCSSVECLSQTCITRLIASGDTIKEVEVTNAAGECIKIAADDVIVNHGYEQDTELLQNSGLNIELGEYGTIKGTSTSETSVPGLFAAGDILKHDGKLNLIAGAFQDAANAVNKAKQFIEPEAGSHAMVSSHNEVFKERNRELLRKSLN
ncbi:NAD(P)/FAD-dependent oxidoreductase [Metabacillus sp. GX 13764]|uniref:NAD(P)/FAD-dependent oxidoreductase n=1 Tax=Metabacillus kandeliae TaxID=2900151 RepID=UPI001E60DF4A|nr:NAD(P)/FAD-dependent oxidoreductase [Metabacillus kandeliae]MCD7034359.1 NAD(P)/FAD-dependent oxidoreductase [Metabacillus kandeliae]